MARYEYVSIGTDLPRSDVVEAIGAALGVHPAETVSGPHYRLGATSGAWLNGADWLEGYPYEVQVRDLDRSGPEPYAAQEAAARRVYDALAAATDWRLALALDGGETVVATRPAEAAVA